MVKLEKFGDYSQEITCQFQPELVNAATLEFSKTNDFPFINRTIHFDNKLRMVLESYGLQHFEPSSYQTKQTI